MKPWVIVLLLTIVLTACSGAPAPAALPAEAPAFDITGEWDYEMLRADGAGWDAGTITFVGTTSQGEYIQINIYEIEYRGGYNAGGNALQLSGYLNWQGAFADANTLIGSWSDQENNETGTFTATRK